jgi:hypothetical protein
MAAQGEGDQSSSHIINKKKASADRHAGFEEFMTPPTPVENKGRYPFSLAFRVLISIAEQFCRKFALYKRKDCLSLEENECLWAVFEHFSVQHDGDLCKQTSSLCYIACSSPNARPILTFLTASILLWGIRQEATLPLVLMDKKSKLSPSLHLDHLISVANLSTRLDRIDFRLLSHMPLARTSKGLLVAKRNSNHVQTVPPAWVLPLSDTAFRKYPHV